VQKCILKEHLNLLDICTDFFFSVALRPNAGHGLLILEVF